ncbi:MAG: GNAT family N-acetyltransferase [Planctomycetota bacterium]|nr:MAG: GNAT family N-acetyltransferase [Planctomycetota bacterium]
MQNYTLRVANNQDISAIKELVFKVLLEFGLHPDPSSTDADLNDIDANYLNHGGMFYVIENADGQIVGTGGIALSSTKVCELRKMYLVPSERGAGLGKKMLHLLLAEAKTLGFQQVTLETASVLKNAIILYKAAGFLPYQPDHLSPRCDQAYKLDLN